MKDLDTLDKKILVELDKNSRKNCSDLAKILKQGRDTVEYRIKRLIELGIINRFVASFNPAFVGLTVFSASFQVENDQAQIVALKKYLLQEPEVCWVCDCTGKWDLVVVVAVRSPAAFYDWHADLLTRYSQIIIDYESAVIVDVWSSGKDYLLPARSKGTRVIGGGLVNNRIDAVDYGILKELSENCREPVAEIATRLKTTPAVVNHRIKKLEETQIISAYRLDVNLERLGFMHFKSQVFFSRYSKEADDALRDYCLEHSFITSYIRQIGSSSVEIEIEVPSFSMYEEIIATIRARFAGMIRNMETMVMKQSMTSWRLPGIDLG